MTSLVMKVAATTVSETPVAQGESKVAVATAVGTQFGGPEVDIPLTGGKDLNIGL